jgi:pyrimidine and pyridine-specific 5'-nucleotidase
MAELQEEHQRQITHYKNLLVRAQSASASSIHDLHTRLQELQKRYDALSEEHGACGSLAREQGSADGHGIGRMMRDRDQSGRMRVLHEVLEGE